jgi:hypothetical protein
VCPTIYQIDVLDERHGDDLLVVIGVDEVDVVGEPADGEDDDNHHEHLDNLQHQINYILEYVGTWEQF